MSNVKISKWFLRIGIAAVFILHGLISLYGGEEGWVGWIMAFTGWGESASTKALFLVGSLDLFVGLVVLVKPIRIVLLWAAIWTFWTAFMTMLSFTGGSFSEYEGFIEKTPNWIMPLALLFLLGMPHRLRGWFR